MTWDGGVVRLFLDGAEIAAQPSTGGLVTSSGDLRIGGSAAGGGEFFAGLIDEVRVYDRPLGAQRIVDDMRTPVTP